MASSCPPLRHSIRDLVLLDVVAIVVTLPFVCLLCSLLPATAAAQDKTGVDDQVRRDWHSRIRPLIETNCLDCHSGESADGSLDLDAFNSLDDVVAARREWSKIATRVADGQMPPPDYGVVEASDRDFLAEWVRHDLAEVPCQHQHHAGAVTIRRLTRYEYANTVRDLLKIEYDPTEAFPSDETGYGFDNIGDVLSVSPLLLEKYLSAAESIAGRVIEDPAESHVAIQVNAGELDRISGSHPRNGGQVLSTQGTLRVPIRIAKAGDYRVAVESGAEQAGDEFAKFAISANGELLKAFEVRVAVDAPEEFDAVVTLDAGTRFLELSFLNDFYDPDAKDRSRRDRNLWFGNIVISGPVGTMESSPEEKHFLFRTPEDFPELGEREREVAAARSIIRLHGSRAWRRPLHKDEIELLVGLYWDARDAGETWQGGMRVVLQGMLTSPHFLYKVEKPAPKDGSPRALNDFELATSLAYTLWGTMPDNELFRLASSGDLAKESVLIEQTRRMLQDARSRFLVENFAVQWLQLRTLPQADPDPDLFPAFDETIRDAFLMETQLLLNEVIRNDQPLTQLLDAKHTWLNRSLAQFYGLPSRGLNDREFIRVSLPADKRGGLLTHGSFLLTTSNPTRTSPVKRGKWVLENLLNDPPPPALPDVPQLDSQKQLTGNLRQRMEQHRADPNCAVCHLKMDSIGFALENFNAVGEFRAEAEGQPIDARGTFPDGRVFTGAAELQALILRDYRDDFFRCFVEKLFIYSLGRGPTESDDCVIDGIAREASRSDKPASWIMEQIVTSEPFRYRCRPVDSASATIEGDDQRP